MTPHPSSASNRQDIHWSEYPKLPPSMTPLSDRQTSHILLGSILLNYRFICRTCSHTLSLVSHLHPIIHWFIQRPTRNHQTPKSCLSRLPMSVHLLRKIVSKPSWNRTLQSCTCFQNLHIYDIECISWYFHFLIEVAASCALLELHNLWIWNSTPYP